MDDIMVQVSDELRSVHDILREKHPQHTPLLQRHCWRGRPDPSIQLSLTASQPPSLDRLPSTQKDLLGPPVSTPMHGGGSAPVMARRLMTSAPNLLHWGDCSPLIQLTQCVCHH